MSYWGHFVAVIEVPDFCVLKIFFFHGVGKRGAYSLYI
jgi:hypothetical protein